MFSSNNSPPKFDYLFGDGNLMRAGREPLRGAGSNCPKILSEDFGWDKYLAKKIWCFGPEGKGPNMVLDTRKGVQYLSESKIQLLLGFS